ncbi:UDP-N-acetylmuramate--L-alanine ligase [Thermaurantimonas aggregans]|uniref:UDP-N-acetylmuramate--L-alanine ligase n=1 Tax=Thermaurantimonas aggregans TaxID=2173829 RepID=A0A401XLN0_9FLAO|nr:UDP-N-acetylmuramate--L-alanine ligase [Thermaurantimonas aggregans]MCX8147824.1 UDP-N-acetylmuramate--L-alanine ligase [Thermaurantimonas aggregans]GCD77926.1 UDP-N-acetylmuramate--L-alanine ligase [Thermaurantimonas aggregans]
MNRPIDTYKYFYFIGIGGIGMSALARYFNLKKAIVSGFDRERTTLTTELEAEGIAITYSDTIDALPMRRIGTPADTLVVYTPAVPQSNQQMIWFRERNFTLMKRAQVLGLITKSSRSIAVAGTHGKTTTTALVAHILKHNNIDVSAFIGGISANYNTNFLYGNSNTMVIEADEFDRSFLRLEPSLAVITSTDPDHLDIYKDQEGVREAFLEFARIAKKFGKLLTKINLPVSGDFSYGLNKNAHYYAEDIQIQNRQFHYTLSFPNGEKISTSCQVPGIHNVENAVAAAGLCHIYGLTPTQIAEGIKTFKGVKRRFEIILQLPNLAFIDDYAHHPAELEALLKSARLLYPDRKITIIFQPHLYSRTRDFHQEFAESLSIADRVVLLDIYPAREEKIEGVTEELIYKHLTCAEKDIVFLGELMDFVKKIRLQNDVIITAGAGNISDAVEGIKNILYEKKK